MKELTTVLEFNSAISGVRESDGAFVEKDHNELVKPLRGVVMSQTDGITGMNIGRYGARVQHFAEIVSREQVLAVFQTAVDALMEMTDTNLFPLRGDKTPTVSIEPAYVPKPNHKKMVIAGFNTDITTFSKDGKAWDEFVAMVGEAVSCFDGARDYTVRLREVGVTIDTRHASTETAQAFMKKVLELLWESGKILPFAPFDTNRITFRYTDVS